MSMYKVCDVVKVKPSWKSYIFGHYYGSDLRGKTGTIIELYSEGRARVRFPKITRQYEDNREIKTEDFIWPFWIKDLESVREKEK